jgi:hypothetical protein
MDQNAGFLGRSSGGNGAETPEFKTWLSVATFLVSVILLTSCNGHKPSDHQPETTTREDESLKVLRAKRVFFTADIIPDIVGTGWPAEVLSVPKGAYVFYASADIDVPILKSYRLRFKVYDGASKLVSNQRGFFEPQKKVGQVRVQGGEDVMALTGKTDPIGASSHEFLVSNSASIDSSSVPGKWKVEFFLDDQKIGEGQVRVEGNP